MCAQARVTYFINSLEQGGAEGQLYALIAGLDRKRYACSLVVCTRKGASTENLDLVDYHSLDSPVFPTPGGVARLTAVLRDWRPDVVHAYKGWENLVGRVAARRAGVPVVVGSVRRPRLPRLECLGEALTWRMTDAVMVNSVGIRDELVRDARVPTDRVSVIENGVDLRRFAPFAESQRIALRAAHGMTGTLTLVTPARISPEKNQLAILRAMGRLARNRSLPDNVRLVMAGRDSLPMYGRAVKLAARIHGIADRVTFAGAVSRIQDLVAASDGVLLPSRFEGLPNAVIEAMACGVPVMVSREANADRLVEDGVHGLVARTPDVDGITEVLERYLTLDESRRQAMGARGRSRAVERYGVARMVAETAAVYERLLGRASAAGA